MLRNYSDINYVLDLEVNDFFNLVNELINELEIEKLDSLIMNMWSTEYPFLQEKIGFLEYKKKVMKKSEKGTDRKKKIKNKEEFISKIENIKKMHQEGRKEV